MFKCTNVQPSLGSRHHWGSQLHFMGEDLRLKAVNGLPEATQWGHLTTPTPPESNFQPQSSYILWNHQAWLYQWSLFKASSISLLTSVFKTLLKLWGSTQRLPPQSLPDLSPGSQLLWLPQYMAGLLSHCITKAEVPSWDCCPYPQQGLAHTGRWMPK